MNKMLWTMGVLAMLTTDVVAQPATKPTLESRWADLTSPEEGKATRAILALAAEPKETMALLQERLKPVKADPKRVEHLVKQLDSGNFGVRNQATMELEYFGKYIKADLEAALKKDPTVETKTRLKQLLDKMPKVEKAVAPPMPKLGGGKSVSVTNINGQITILIDGQPLDMMPKAPVPPQGPSSSWVRAVRAVTLLEHLGSPEARALLQAMAAGEADALPTVAARAALERLKK